MFNDFVFVDIASFVVDSTGFSEVDRDEIVFMELFGPPFRYLVLDFVFNLVLVGAPCESLSY